MKSRNGAGVDGGEAELQLIREAAKAGTRDHWKVGAAVAEWFRKFAQGRGDAEFSEAVNSENPDADFTPDYVRRCRNVCEAFPKRVGALSWSHHLRAWEGSAGNREAAREWLGKAIENKWSVRDLLAAMDEKRAAAEDSGFEVISGDTVLPSESFGAGDEAPFEDDEEAEPAGAGRRGPQSARDAGAVELVEIETGRVNERTMSPERREPIPVAAGPADDATPEDVGRWLCAVVEQPAMVLHHQVLRKPERVSSLPAKVRNEIEATVDRLLATLNKIKEVLHARP